MKKAISLILILSLVFTACEKESDINELSENDLRTTRGVSLPNPVMPDYTQFEQDLAWTAYMTTYVLVQNEAYRATFESHLSADNTILLQDIVGDDRLPQFDAFEQEFEYEFIEYIDYYMASIDPNGGIVIRPLEHSNTPPDPPVCTLNCGLTNSGGYHEFIRELLEDNCVELYFPTGANFSTTPLGFKMTSGGHPMNDDYFNDGLSRGPQGKADAITLSPNYVQSRINKNKTVVARPFRSPGLNGICLYPAPAPTDLEFFLGGF